jgi:hypothetical protein
MVYAQVTELYLVGEGLAGKLDSAGKPRETTAE